MPLNIEPSDGISGPNSTPPNASSPYNDSDGNAGGNAITDELVGYITDHTDHENDDVSPSERSLPGGNTALILRGGANTGGNTEGESDSTGSRCSSSSASSIIDQRLIAPVPSHISGPTQPQSPSDPAEPRAEATGVASTPTLPVKRKRPPTPDLNLEERTSVKHRRLGGSPERVTGPPRTPGLTDGVASLLTQASFGDAPASSPVPPPPATPRPTASPESPRSRCSSSSASSFYDQQLITPVPSHISGPTQPQGPPTGQKDGPSNVVTGTETTTDQKDAPSDVVTGTGEDGREVEESIQTNPLGWDRCKEEPVKICRKGSKGGCKDKERKPEPMIGRVKQQRPTYPQPGRSRVIGRREI
ncbi:MAG: hypothetical protein M1823_000089 [Watsoniomyces obsoletus]|nr:MAG: hypothetical protein M1823_000089 [Watsoniomyces obsoletus]